MGVGRRCELCCLFVFLLVATHMALMADTRRMVAIGLQMRPTDGLIATGVADQEGRPVGPQPLLGDCPAQRAVLPLFLLLLLLLLLVSHRCQGKASVADVGTLCRWQHRISLPPPLAPARRRAVLQIFLN